MKPVSSEAAPVEPSDPGDMLRIIDETGEAWFYDRSWFKPVALPDGLTTAEVNSIRELSRGILARREEIPFGPQRKYWNAEKLANADVDTESGWRNGDRVLSRPVKISWPGST